MVSIDAKSVAFAIAGSFVTAASIFLYIRIDRGRKLRKLKTSLGMEREEYESVPATPFSRPGSREKLNDFDGGNKGKQQQDLNEEEQVLVREQLARNEVFFGPDNLKTIQDAFVIVVGLGGVGSHAAVHLLRSGVMKLRLIDFDQVTLSSLNRHAVAVRSDVGTPKVQAMKRYLRKIFPKAEIDTRNTLFTIDVADELLISSRRPDFILDCIDNVDTKIDLLVYCVQNGIPVISSMGSACKADPSRVQIADISATSEDPLAKTVRYKLRKRGIESGIPVVYSTERPKAKIVPIDDKMDDPQEFATLPNFRVRVLPVLGALPAIFGAAMSSFVLCRLGKFPLDPVPIKNRTSFYQRVYKDVMKRVPVDHISITLADCGYLVDEIWHGRSALSGKVDHLVLCRWDNSKSLTIDNSVLMTVDEADKHSGKTGSLYESYEEKTLQRIENKLKFLQDNKSY